MSVITFIYEAKCKHCKHLVAKYRGRRKYHECALNVPRGMSITLKTKACDKIELV